LAAELVRMKADVIIPWATNATRAAIDATKQIPIVMTSVDPTAFVTNISHPGGNVTGVAGFTCEVAAKRLQLLKQAVPTVSRIAALRNLDAAASHCDVQETEPRSKPVSRFGFFFCAPTMIRFRPSRK
jgi:ABC-type uncharacterized transport system substrate-binding protein